MKKTIFLATFLFCLSFLSGVALAAAPYFEGKSIRFVIGNPAGGGYDLSARSLCRHMPKYLPGSPLSLLKNMPGAGSLIGANHVYKIAKPTASPSDISMGAFLQPAPGTAGH